MAKDVTILSISGSFRIQGDNKAYKQMLTKIKNSNPAENPADLEYLEQEVDIDSFLDWFTVEMFFGNSDIGTGEIYRVSGGKWKCLITDLDNTLWGGVIGDDGLENIQIGHFGIGRVFTELQLWMKKLRERGIILCVVSKTMSKQPVSPL